MSKNKKEKQREIWRKASLKYYNKNKDGEDFREKTRKVRRNYYKKNRDKEDFIKKNLEDSKRYYENNKEKVMKKKSERDERNYIKDKPKISAKNKIRYRVINGKMPKANKLKCNRCEKNATQYHHSDYNKPLEVEPLCGRCHKLEHVRND